MERLSVGAVDPKSAAWISIRIEITYGIKDVQFFITKDYRGKSQAVATVPGDTDKALALQIQAYIVGHNDAANLVTSRRR